MGATIVRYNGSKWAGEEPDTIATLLEVLAREPLDRRFELYGCFSMPHETLKGTTHFFGNFFAVSHAFSVESSDNATCEALTSAIKANMRTPAYLEQDTPIAWVAK